MASPIHSAQLTLDAAAPSGAREQEGALTRAPAAAGFDRLLDIRRIYVEPGAATLPRGQQVLERFPDAERIEVASHWNIPGLHGDPAQADDWLRNKREALVLGVLKSLRVRDNGRSADFIAPSLSNGCAMACAYCYVPRRKGYANPITVFANPDASIRAVQRHLDRVGRKQAPTQCDPVDWVYDLGENSDCSVDAAISDNVRDAVEAFANLPGAKASFATKFVNRDLLSWRPAGARIRFSLMPERVSRRLDVRTAPIAERIAAIDDFVAAGWEVHVNFSPVVVYDGWTRDWAELFDQLSDAVGARARAQLAAEVIFLTHNEALHETNLRWHRRAEELLWTPQWQEAKLSTNGQQNLRYRRGLKGDLVSRFRELASERIPWCPIRYAF